MDKLSEIAVFGLIHALKANARLDALIQVLNLSDEQNKQYINSFIENIIIELNLIRPTLGDDVVDDWILKIRESAIQ